MSDKNYQIELLEACPLVLDLPDARISYQDNFLREQDAWKLFDRLKEGTDWRQESVKVYGKYHRAPRLSCWMADEACNYSYSNMTMTPVKWTSEICQIKDKLLTRLGLSFNSVLINYYRTGQDSNGWHADNEPELGVNPVIASISLGANRDFNLRHRYDRQQKHSMLLKHASLLLMQGTTQSFWQHQIPKRVNVGPRINLTFRTIKTIS